MPLAKLIRTVLGFESSRSTETTDTTSVTVEHEPDEPAEAEANVDRTTGADQPKPGHAGDQKPVDASTPANEDTGEATDDTAIDESQGDQEESDLAKQVSGIGPAYADRLADAGVSSIQDLIDADPETLAAETDVSAKRITRWQERAEEF